MCQKRCKTEYQKHLNNTKIAQLFIVSRVAIINYAHFVYYIIIKGIIATIGILFMP